MFRNPGGDKPVDLDPACSSDEDTDDQNVFAALQAASIVRSPGQLTHVVIEVGGQYRRNR